MKSPDAKASKCSLKFSPKMSIFIRLLCVGTYICKYCINIKNIYIYIYCIKFSVKVRLYYLLDVY